MKNNSGNTLDEKSLYKYALWTDMLRMKFEASFALNRQEMVKQLQSNDLAFDRKLLETSMYHFLWFGALSTVIEGWPRLKQNAPRITMLLRNPFKKLLSDFRHATFHPVNFDDPRILTLMNTGQESIDWARELTLEFISFFESDLFDKNRIT